MLFIIILIPILDGFFKRPFESEAAGFHLLAANVCGDLELFDTRRADAHRTADEFCTKGGGHYDCVRTLNLFKLHLQITFFHKIPKHSYSFFQGYTIVWKMCLNLCAI